MKAREKTDAPLKALTLKIRKDTWLAWKFQAAREETTMSEIADKIVMAYCQEADNERALDRQRSRRAAGNKAAHGRESRPAVRKDRRQGPGR
jgi:hypothetical protein